LLRRARDCAAFLNISPRARWNIGLGRLGLRGMDKNLFWHCLLASEHKTMLTFEAF